MLEEWQITLLYVIAPVFIWSAISLVYHLIRAPLLLKYEDNENIIKSLSSFYEEGKNLFDSGFHNQETKDLWLSNLSQWTDRLENFIRNEMSVSAFHQYKNTENGWFEMSGNFNNDFACSTEHLSDQQIYRAKLNFISEYIAYNGAVIWPRN